MNSVPGIRPDQLFHLRGAELAVFAINGHQPQAVTEKFRRPALVIQNVGVAVAIDSTPWRRGRSERDTVCRRPGAEGDHGHGRFEQLGICLVEEQGPLVFGVSPGGSPIGCFQSSKNRRCRR